MLIESSLGVGAVGPEGEVVGKRQMQARVVPIVASHVMVRRRLPWWSVPARTAAPTAPRRRLRAGRPWSPSAV